MFSCHFNVSIKNQEYWLKPRKRWLRHDMTEKLLTGMLGLSTNKYVIQVVSVTQFRML